MEEDNGYRSYLNNDSRRPRELRFVVVLIEEGGEGQKKKDAVLTGMGGGVGKGERAGMYSR